MDYFDIFLSYFYPKISIIKGIVTIHPSVVTRKQPDARAAFLSYCSARIGIKDPVEQDAISAKQRNITSSFITSLRTMQQSAEDTINLRKDTQITRSVILWNVVKNTFYAFLSLCERRKGPFVINEKPFRITSKTIHNTVSCF